jgi:hypothetical protein
MSNPVVQPIDLLKRFVDLFESGDFRYVEVPVGGALKFAEIMRQPKVMLEMKRRSETTEPLMFDPWLDLPGPISLY